MGELKMGKLERARNWAALSLDYNRKRQAKGG